MSNITCISGGRVIDPANNRDATGDIYAVDGKIVPDLSEQNKKQAQQFKADGMIVCPGLVDIHTHLCEPGDTHRESIQTGTWAAAAGGFTSIVCMPNKNQPSDNAGTIQQINDAVKRDALVNVFPTGALTKGMKGKELAPAGSLKRSGIVAITDSYLSVQNNEIMRRAIEYAHMFDLVVMDHSQDEALTDGAVMNEGIWSLRLGLRGWPSAAEDIIVSRNVILSTYTGAHIHLQQISTSNAVEIIRRAKLRQVNISAEVTPHHLSLSDECIQNYDTNFKTNPPLRTLKDQAALIDGLNDGTIDCISTNHMPHTDYEKNVEFDHAPFGVIGLETSLAVSLKVLVHSQKCNLSQLIKLLTCNPSNLLKLGKGTLSPGADADITLFDPNEEWVVDVEKFQSRSSNSPWIGETLRGKVKQTFVSGKLVWDKDHVILPEMHSS